MTVEIREVQKIESNTLYTGYKVTCVHNGETLERTVVNDMLYGSQAHNQSIFGDMFSDTEWTEVTKEHTPMAMIYKYDGSENFWDAEWECKPLKRFVLDCEEHFGIE